MWEEVRPRVLQHVGLEQLRRVDGSTPTYVSPSLTTPAPSAPASAVAPSLLLLLLVAALVPLVVAVVSEASALRMPRLLLVWPSTAGARAHAVVPALGALLLLLLPRRRMLRHEGRQHWRRRHPLRADQRRGHAVGARGRGRSRHQIFTQEHTNTKKSADY